MAERSTATTRAVATWRSSGITVRRTSVDLDPGFTPEDQAALAGDWSWLLDVVRPAVRAGPGGLIDDDLAAVAPGGFDPADLAVPTLLVHGGRDRVVPSSHSVWLSRRIPSAGLWLRPSD
jgi:pimeloyl-ACP methyl ester carboxylesterase